MITKLNEPWFLFALIWSVGGTCYGDGRKKFSDFMRKKCEEEKVSSTDAVLMSCTDLSFTRWLCHSLKVD